MIPYWPSNLPPPIGQLGTLGSERLYDAPQETSFDDGPSRSRRRRLFDETPRAIVLTLSRAQFPIFRAFLRDTLNQGTRRFSAQVRLPDGSLGNRICRFAAPPSEQDHGANAIVSFTLTIRDW